MDLGEFRSFISDSGIDVWTWIDMAISVASSDHENELKNRRDGIVQKLYSFSRCRNCDVQENEICQKKQDMGFDHSTEGFGSGKKAAGNEEDDDNDDEQRKILEIKNLLDDQNQQNERCLIDLLQRLVDMDTTFKALKETDIGRHVTRLRKHSSNEVRRLVKILVRKWKDTVDEWVRLNTSTEEATQINGDKKSPNGYLTPEKGNVKHNQIESDKINSSTKRFHDQNYQETRHDKKRRTGQVMDFNSVTKTKNAVVTNNGGSVHVKY